MELKINTLLRNGTYRILKKLGQGSFGITYLAEHTAQGKKVAIKEFFMKGHNFRLDDGSITGMTVGSFSYNYGQKFKREVINLAKLEHPNIVRVTDYFEENNTYYYIMDFVEGENLNDYLNSHTVSENEAIAIIKDVASALTYMHDQHHMLHLDIKPGNIMRRASDGHIFLIDFGLSKHYNSDGQPETSTTIGLGTPGYAPIEQGNQARGGEFRPTIDVYALGATLYKLLTGETPPAASDVLADKEQLSNKLNKKGISQSVTNLVMAAMEPIAKNRIPTVNEFSRRLAEGNSIPPIPKKPSDYNHNRESTRFANPYTEETKFASNNEQVEQKHQAQNVNSRHAYLNNNKQQPGKKKKYKWLWIIIGFVIGFVIIVGAIGVISENSHDSTQTSSLTSPRVDIMQPQEFNNYIANYNYSHQAYGIALTFDGNYNTLQIVFYIPPAQYQRLPSFGQWNHDCFKLDNRFLSTLRNLGCTIYIYFYDPYTNQLFDTMTVTSGSY
ncbi:MAG: serine/threonine protein kinase [Muribaculaceae bacterium]|nr:serine/threonine protein kinase [Muribaculaceae bacterium]